MDETPTKPASPFRRPLIAAAALLVPLAALCWLVASETGFQLLCAVLERISAGRLTIEAPGGRLLGDWRAQSVRWVDDAHDVELRQLELDWSPRDLLGRRVTVERLEAASLRVFAAPGSEPATIPASLTLPFPASIRRLAIGTLLSGRQREQATTLAEHIEAALDSDGQRHRIERLELHSGQLQLVAKATLAARQPYDLDAEAALRGSALDRSFKLDLRGSGPLAQIQVSGKIAADADAAATGDLHALLTPFAVQPIASLSARFTGIDPAAFVAKAPQASLDVEAVLENEPAAPGETAVSGRLSVVNRLAGALDRQRIPIESLHTGLDWQGNRLGFSRLALALTGGGRLQGRGAFADGTVNLELDASAVDARSLHGELLPTRLAGPLRVQLGGDRQSIDLKLRDAQYAIDAQASVTTDAVEVSRLQVGTGDARLSAQGSLALNGDKRFAAQGQLHNFDPARFFKTKSPLPSLINADLDARGALSPALELALHFDLHDSRLGAQKLAGKGDVDLRGERLHKIEIDLDAAGNRLTATGAFGKAGDAMHLRLVAPRLEAIGFAGLAGDASADVLVGGNLTNLEFSGDVRSERLRVAQWLDLNGVSLAGQLAEGAQGTLRGQFRCTACALPAYGVPALSLELAVDGTRNQHRLHGLIGLPEKRELRFAFDGGFPPSSLRRASAVPTLAWNGQLSELNVTGDRSSGKPLLHLAAPAPLNLGSAAIAFGPATIDGIVGDLRIERLGREQGRWQSMGRWRQISPQAILAEFPSLRAALGEIGKDNPQPLILSGEWAFDVNDKPGALPVGRVAVWRESGDFVLGSVPLGLEEVRVQANVGEGRLLASATIRGGRLGDIGAELEAPSARRADGGIATLVDPAAPWQGQLRAAVPDVGWLGPLIGEGWHVAGRLNGEMRLGGSPSHPQLSGEWRGQELAVRALDLGMRLERGQALLEVTPERLLLRQLSFESDFQPLPPVLKLDRNVNAASLTGTPGRVEASGELALATASSGRDAQLKVRLDRLGVVQRADQWIALSGEGDVRVGEKALDLGGKLRVDAGLWSLAESGRPSLSDDVVIRQAQAEGDARSQMARRLRLDIEAALGRSAHFRGAGVESRLAGQIRVRSDDAGLPRASGSISTVNGQFNAYGQKLGIQRGIINFQGAIDNPGLNILAVRENLPVEAGVEVTGTALRPRIRLVSTPDVPDTEKLSWLVLGHAPEQQGGADGGVLLAAARTILGGQDNGLLSRLQQGLGIDEFGVSTGEIGGYGDNMTSRVASSSGFSGNQTVSGQIITVGKRLSSNAMLSYEQSLGTSDSIVKLTVDLSRRFSVVGRAGSESALDFFWHYRFGK
ncbi:MAG: translocation/assembly module TamB domain-containing protein [Propionivibrio sp.]